MNHSVSPQQSRGFLILAISMTTCLILLINVSFKIITLYGLIFAVNSLLCPLITGLYLLVLRHCTHKEQRHILNTSLITLYIFCIGIYLLVNLPAAEYMNDNQVYQIIFEDIPKKFFATTLAFGLGFYLPHLLLCRPPYSLLHSPKESALLALFGGLGFFCMNFFLLFSGPHSDSFQQVFIDSLMIALVVLLLIGVSYLVFLLCSKKPPKKMTELEKKSMHFPMYSYLICFAVAILLMCLACEYRIVALGRDGVLTASSLFFPITLIISTLVGEWWGYHANLKLTFILIAAQIIFDGLLMGIVSLPSPDFFNLNPFYNYIMPRRLPAASFALFATFLSNAMLLHYLKQGKWSVNTPTRILIANVCANSLLCLVNYSLLFGGIYPNAQILSVAVNVWDYKLLISLLSLPLILKLSRSFDKNQLAM